MASPRKTRGMSSERAKEVADRYFDLDTSSTEPPDADDDAAGGFEPPPRRRRRAKAEKPPKEPDPPVTDKQARFIEEYPVDFNGTAAAIRAGYSEKTAAQQAYENLRKPHIARAIEQRIKHLSAQAGWDAQRVLVELGQRLMADDRDIFDENGAIKPMSEWPEIFGRGLVTGLKSKEIADMDGEVIGIVHEVKFADRTRILDMIGKHRLVQAWKESKTPEGPKETPLTRLARELNGSGLKPKEIEGTARTVGNGP